MNRTIYLIICLLPILFCDSASAHQDRIIDLKNGELIGLPEKYQPAYLNIEKKTLQIGATRFEFPACVSKYFPETNDYDIQITSSWYHDLSKLPPYLTISIRPKGKDYSFNLLFDMDTLKPYKFEIQIHESDTVTSFHELDISAICQKNIEKSYTKIKP